jgi:hypothetical protein
MNILTKRKICYAAGLVLTTGFFVCSLILKSLFFDVLFIGYSVVAVSAAIYFYKKDEYFKLIVDSIFGEKEDFYFDGEKGIRRV